MKRGTIDAGDAVAKGEQGTEYPCLTALHDALVRADVAAAGAIGRRCARSAVPAEALEATFVDAERIVAARLRLAGAGARLGDLEALQVAIAAAPSPSPIAEAAPEGDGGASIMLAALPGDLTEGGRGLWRWLLLRRGYAAVDLGVKAPAIVAARAVDATAVGVYVSNRRTRTALQTLVAQLLLRGVQVPVLVGGPGVDAEFAAWVAIPAGGEPYWGGVYFCEDGDELLDVLRQIVLFTPPPPAHVHGEHGAAADADTCASCDGCPLVGTCDAASEL